MIKNIILIGLLLAGLVLGYVIEDNIEMNSYSYELFK